MKYLASRDWPRIEHDAKRILDLFGPHADAFQKSLRTLLQRDTPICSLDLEFNENTPTILGLSDGVLHISVPWQDGRDYLEHLLALRPDIYWVGHFLISADIQVLAKEGIALYRQNVTDTAIWHWLCGMHLCKGTGKTEDGHDKRGKGYMNLWSFASLYTNLPNWKGKWGECRGVDDGCDGEGGKKPCNVHSPYLYTGVDAACCSLGLPIVVRKARLWQVAHLHDLHRDLLWAFCEMSNYGVRVDVPYVAQLRDELAEDKLRIEKMLPFNPKSPTQGVGHFKKKGIVLANAQEETIRKAVEESDDEELELWLDHKELGNGPDRWFGPKYIGADERIHCRLGAWTSSGRMLASDPNLNNVGKRRVNRHQCNCAHTSAEHIVQLVDGKEKKVCAVVGCKCKSFSPVNVGKKLRRAIIASDGTYFVDADYKNGENLVFLYLSGYEPPTEDFHTWMAKTLDIDDSHPFAMKEGSAREAAKTVVHGSGDYGEGLQLKYASELRQPRIKKEIESEARLVCWDWTFRGKIVTFTGVNLARRAFGKASLENRRVALDIVKRYFDRFPNVRELQMRIAKQVEQEGGVRPPHNYFTRLFGQDEDCLKSAFAITGSQPIAHFLKLAITGVQRRFEQEGVLRGLLPIHDELLCEVPDSLPPDQACTMLREGMEVETPEMPGLCVPASASYGTNWRDLTKQKTS